MRDYYFIVHPPKEPEEDDGMTWHGEEQRVVDFDKMSAQRRAAMRFDWASESKKGEPV